MSTAADVVKSKPSQAVYTMGPDATVFDAVSLMAQKNIGALLVVEGEQAVGIVTERDVARKLVLLERLPKETSLHRVMATPVMVGPQRTSEECMALMTEHRVRHLLVIDDDKPSGLVSIGDLVKGIISEQQFIIEHLERYITS